MSLPAWRHWISWRTSTELVDRLWENTRYFKAEMKRLGFDTGKSITPITPVMFGEAPLAQQFSRELFEAVCSPWHLASRQCRGERRASG